MASHLGQPLPITSPLNSSVALSDDAAALAPADQRTAQLEELQNDISAFFRGKRCPNLSLFEIACLGKPELALQGELLHHLRTKGWLCVQEAGYLAADDNLQKKVSRNLDLLVFGKGRRADGPFQPLCCIELKHFSSNQGSAAVLTTGLDTDFQLKRPTDQGHPIPLVQVGVFTTILRFERSPKKPGLHRFARTAPKAPKKPDFDTVLEGWAAQHEWEPKPSVIAKRDLVDHSFCLQTGERLTGYVEAFIGVRAWKAAALLALPTAITSPTL